jgi:hypothetical protein
MLLALYGGLATAHLAISALLLRLWSQNRSPLLMFFAAAFCLMSIAYVLQCCFQIGLLPRSPAFLVRLTAFVLIIVGIVTVNMRRRAD